MSSQENISKLISKQPSKKFVHKVHFCLVDNFDALLNEYKYQCKNCEIDFSKSQELLKQHQNGYCTNGQSKWKTEDMAEEVVPIAEIFVTLIHLLHQEMIMISKITITILIALL